MNGVNEARFLELNEDEAEHRRLVTGDIARNLDQANSAAALALNGLMAAEDLPGLNEPKGIAFLLLAKAAQNVRFACIGLSLGYYSGAYGALRSSFEALIYAALFSSHPHEIPIWIKNEFSQSPEPGRTEQKRRAKWAWLNLERSRHVIKEELMRFVEDGNGRIHATVRGLAEEFGIDIEYLLPDGLEDAFLQVGEDFDKALGFSALTSKLGTRPAQRSDSSGQGERQTIYVDLTGRYDPEVMQDIAIFIYYLGHRLLDMTADTFTITDRDFKRGYRDWHKESQKAS